MEIFHPVDVDLAESVGLIADPAVLDNVNCRLYHRAHLNEPLVRRKRLNRVSAAVALADVVAVRLDLDEESLCFKIGNDLLACLVSVKTLVFTAVLVYRCVIVHYLDYFKLVALTYHKVIRVVRRCYLNTSCTEFLINVFIGNYGNFSVNKRQNKCFADKVCVSFVLGVNCNGSIA